MLGAILSVAWLFWFRKKNTLENVQLLKKMLRVNRFTVVALITIILGGLVTSLRYDFRFEPVLRGTTVLMTPFYEDRWTNATYWIPQAHLSERWSPFPAHQWSQTASKVWVKKRKVSFFGCPLSRRF